MLGDKVLKSRKSDEWRTPHKIIKYIESQGYKIGWDLACTSENCIEGAYPCVNFSKFTVESCKDSLSENEISFCNPPYSQSKNFIEIIYNSNIPCVLLLPARTDTKWFHRFIYNKKNVKIEFIKGRLKFSGSPHNAPFPSMLVYMNIIHNDIADSSQKGFSRNP